ncbi:MAG: hypothetical protein GY711_02045 [bacterium]|nr:hypothetical protein [bacterium]
MDPDHASTVHGLATAAHRLFVAGAALSALNALAAAQCPRTELASTAPRPYDLFGEAVAIEGRLAAVGAMLEDQPVASTGAAYVFERTGGVWGNPVRLQAPAPIGADWFGAALAWRESALFVSAKRRAPTGGPETGSVLLFEQVAGAWTATDELVPSDGEHFDWFGAALAVDGDWACIGAPFKAGATPSRGAVYFFERTPMGWEEQFRIANPDPATRLWFGWRVALEGDTALVAARDPDGGAVYVYRHSAGGWTQADLWRHPALEAGADFGQALALAGGTALVGAPRDDGADTDAGAAYLFQQLGATWLPAGRLEASDAAAGDRFGTSAALDGELLVIGAPEEDTLAPDAGAAYVFLRAEFVWRESARLRPAAPAADLGFANALAACCDAAVVGARKDSLPSAPGRAFVFEELTTCGAPVGLGVHECSPAVESSAGWPGSLSAVGSAFAGLGTFALEACHLPRERFALALAGRSPGVLQPPGSSGVLCLGGDIARLLATLQSTGGAGTFRAPVDLASIPTNPPQPVLAGETWRFQVWFRDDLGGPTSNFTDAVVVPFH